MARTSPSSTSPAHKVVGNIAFDHGVRPHCPMIGPKDGLLYVTTELDQTITIIDPKTLKIVGTIPTGQPESHMLALSHDGRRAYTANVGPGTVSVIDIQARKVLKVIPISANTQRISISPDDKWVFTADQTKPQMAVIDTATSTVAKWIPMEGIGYGSAPTPDGRWLLVALPDQNKVAVIDLKIHAGRAHRPRRQLSAGSPRPPRRQIRLRLLRTRQPGRRNRHRRHGKSPAPSPPANTPTASPGRGNNKLAR